VNSRQFIGWGTLTVVLAASSVALFAIYANYFSEGHGGAWPPLVKGLAWLLLFLALSFEGARVLKRSRRRR